jgi:hypothetical protein
MIKLSFHKSFISKLFFVSNWKRTTTKFIKAFDVTAPYPLTRSVQTFPIPEAILKFYAQEGWH